MPHTTPRRPPRRILLAALGGLLAATVTLANQHPTAPVPQCPTGLTPPCPWTTSGDWWVGTDNLLHWRGTVTPPDTDTSRYWLRRTEP